MAEIAAQPFPFAFKPRTMEASARMGDQATALRAYKGLWDLLETEFDSEPSAATQALVSDIKLGTIGATDRGAVTAIAAEAFGSQAQRLQEPAAGVLLFVREFELVSGSVRARNAVQIFRSELVASLVRFRDWAVMEWEGHPPRFTENAYCIEATGFIDGPTLRLSMLGDRIGKCVGNDLEGVAAGYVDDRPRTVRQHRRQHRLGTEPRGL